MGRVASGLAQPPILGGFLFGKGSRSGQGRVLVLIQVGSLLQKEKSPYKRTLHKENNLTQN